MGRASASDVRRRGPRLRCVGRLRKLSDANQQRRPAVEVGREAAGAGAASGGDAAVCAQGLAGTSRAVDPRGDTPATVKAFLVAHEMTGRMEYLIGSFRQLAPVWRAYGVEVQASPDKREDTLGHSAFLYGITGRGSAQVLYPPTFDPTWIVHDAPLLAND
jgi:hypothetical protein